MGKNLQFIANTLEMSPFDGIDRTFKLRSMMTMMMHLPIMMMMMIVYELDLMRSNKPSIMTILKNSPMMMMAV